MTMTLSSCLIDIASSPKDLVDLLLSEDEIQIDPMKEGEDLIAFIRRRQKKTMARWAAEAEKGTR